MILLANDHGVYGVMLNLPGRTETVRVFHDGLSTENLKQSQNAPIHTRVRPGGCLFSTVIYKRDAFSI